VRKGLEEKAEGLSVGMWISVCEACVCVYRPLTRLKFEARHTMAVKCPG